ncbi:MAG: cytochrome c3 family protein [Thermoplasmata archaeon]
MLRPIILAPILLLTTPALLARPAGGAEPIQILHPAPKALVRGAGVVAFVVVGEGRFTARLNDKQLPSPAKAGRVWHWVVRLRAGRNLLAVGPTGEPAVATREIVYAAPFFDEERIPRGFVPRPFHGDPAMERSCGTCHDLIAKPTDRNPTSPEDSSCYTCHRRLVKEQEVHGPAAVWGCLLCHDPQAKPTPYATPARVLEVCYGCHTTQRAYFFSAKYQHGPTSTGRCTICHNPHGSPNPFWLKRAPWDLCTSCHFEKATGRHVIAWGPSGDTHPTRGRPDPMRPERELACNSCHNPHAANSQYLWNFDARRHTELCQTCHKK